MAVLRNNLILCKVKSRDRLIMITGIDEITRAIREVSSGQPTWNQSKNPITVGFSENGHEQSAITRYVSLTCRERTISVNSKRHWISKRKCNFHGAVDGRLVIFYADGVVRSRARLDAQYFDVLSLEWPVRADKVRPFIGPHTAREYIFEI